MRLRHPLYFIMVLLILLSVSVFAAPVSLEPTKEIELIFSDNWKADGDSHDLTMLVNLFAVERTPCEFLYEITKYNLIVLFQGNSLEGFGIDIIEQCLRFAIEF